MIGAKAMTTSIIVPKLEKFSLGNNATKNLVKIYKNSKINHIK